jgi:hypothetical protein
MTIKSKVSPKILIAVSALVCAASTALADGTIYLEVGSGYGQSNPYQYADGGEFTALTTGLGGNVPLTPGLPTGSQVPIGNSLADATLQVGNVVGFETFCVEDQVDFYVGGTYNYTVGTAIQQKNSVGALTAGVSFLYEEFTQGKLAGYDYSDPTQRKLDAGQLQALFWQLEGEPGDPNNQYSSIPETSNKFWVDLTNQFSSTADINALITDPNPLDNPYGVGVLELTDANGNIAQDQLISWGVPDNGTTALLVGISLLGMAAFRRRFKVAASR